MPLHLSGGSTHIIRIELDYSIICGYVKKIAQRYAFTIICGYVKKIAQRYGWELTSDHEAQSDLIEGLTHNFNRYGYYNCPCRDSQNDRKLDRDIIYYFLGCVGKIHYTA